MIANDLEDFHDLDGTSINLLWRSYSLRWTAYSLRVMRNLGQVYNIINAGFVLEGKLMWLVVDKLLMLFGLHQTYKRTCNGKKRKRPRYRLEQGVGREYVSVYYQRQKEELYSLRRRLGLFVFTFRAHLSWLQIVGHIFATTTSVRSALTLFNCGVDCEVFDSQISILAFRPWCWHIVV